MELNIERRTYSDFEDQKTLRGYQQKIIKIHFNIWSLTLSDTVIQGQVNGLSTSECKRRKKK